MNLGGLEEHSFSSVLLENSKKMSQHDMVFCQFSYSFSSQCFRVVLFATMTKLIVATVQVTE